MKPAAHSQTMSDRSLIGLENMKDHEVKEGRSRPSKIQSYACLTVLYRKASSSLRSLHKSCPVKFHGWIALQGQSFFYIQELVYVMVSCCMSNRAVLQSVKALLVSEQYIVRQQPWFVLYKLQDSRIFRKTNLSRQRQAHQRKPLIVLF